MVKIRLTRTGKRNQPHFRIIAVDSRVKRDGKYLAKIGYYNPRTVPPTLIYNKELLKKWMERGAQFTDTTYDIFVREGIIKKASKLRAKRIKLMIERSKKDSIAALQSDSIASLQSKEGKKAEEVPVKPEPTAKPVEEKPEKEQIKEEGEKAKEQHKESVVKPEPETTAKPESEEKPKTVKSSDKAVKSTEKQEDVKEQLTQTTDNQLANVSDKSKGASIPIPPLREGPGQAVTLQNKP